MFLTVLKYYIKRAFAYPTEIVFIIIRKIFILVIVIWVWSVIINDKTAMLTTYIPYFLISHGLADLFSIPGKTPYSSGRLVRKSIKRGEFSNYILLPVNLLKYIYAQVSGQNITLLVLGLIQIMIGFAMVNITFSQFILFLAFAFISFILAILFNLLEAVLAFYFTEATGIKNALRHIYRVFSGEFMPLNLLPTTWQQLIIFSPFAFMNYWPVAIVSKTTPNLNVSLIYVCIIGVLWVIMLAPTMYLSWKKGLKHYEAVGL